MCVAHVIASAVAATAVAATAVGTATTSEDMEHIKQLLGHSNAIASVRRGGAASSHEGVELCPCVRCTFAAAGIAGA